MLHSAANVPIAAKLGDPAAMRPKTAVTPIVRLKAHRLPKISQPKPQKMAPTRRPMFWASVRKGARVGWNSFLTGVKISEVTMGHKLSEAQPKPMTMKSCGDVLGRDDLILEVYRGYVLARKRRREGGIVCEIKKVNCVA